MDCRQTDWRRRCGAGAEVINEHRRRGSTFRLTPMAGHDVIASAVVGDVEADS